MVSWWYIQYVNSCRVGIHYQIIQVYFYNQILYLNLSNILVCFHVIWLFLLVCFSVSVAGPTLL